MKFPFVRSKSRESTATATLVTPPGINSAKPAPAATAVAAPAAAPVHTFSESQTTPTVPICLGSILGQLPAELFQPGASAALAGIKLAVPGSLVLPQLASGKIAIHVADLIPLLPAHVLGNTAAQISEEQSVVLPLAEVIAAIPPEVLTLQHDSAINVDTPEFDKLPKLFDDSLIQEAAAVAAPAPAVQEAPVPEAAPAPAPQIPAVISEQPAKQPGPARPAATGPVPECVAVTLRSLVAALPDKLLAGPRAELWRKADFDVRVPLPVKPILSQLRSARIQLPVETVLTAVPSSLLANPLPPTEGEMITLPLHEIIPQLPPRLFSSVLRRAGDQQFELTDVDIPEPFHERGEGSIFTEGAATEEIEPVKPEALDSEDFDVFSEKPVPTELPKIEPFEEPAPLAAQFQQPPAPVEEPVAEVPAVETPEEEPVAPALADTQLITPPAELVQAAPAPEAEPPVAPEIPVFAETPAGPEAPVEEQAPVEAQASAEEQTPAETHEVVAETQAPSDAPASAETGATEISHEQAADLAGIDEKKFLVDLNRCTVEDLMNIQGIGPALARRIVEFRDERGHFGSIKDLRHIPGVGRKVFHALAGAQPRALNRMLGVDHNRELSLQEIVQLTAGLPGVEGCMLAMSDGLFLTGKLPPHLDQNAISVFAPQLFKKMGRYVRELKVGQVRRFTIFTDQQPLSVFRAGDVFLIVVHDARHFSKALLRRCERISEEIARLCRQRAVV